MTPRFSRLATSWVYGGTLTAVLLLILTPLLTRGWPLPQILTCLSLQRAIAMIQRRRHSRNLCYPAVSRSGPCP